MKLLEWKDRLPGDVFLSRNAGNLLSDGIEAAERALHPEYPPDAWVPSHAGLIGFDDHVIEAWLSLDGENSVACINPCSKYDGAKIEVWRPDGITEDIANAAIDLYISQEIGWPYGWTNLLGFGWEAMVKKLTGHDPGNLIENSTVCSQGVLLYLGKYLAPLVKPALDWAAQMAYDDKTLRAFDPLAARISFLAHQ